MFLESCARALILLHVAAAIVLIGAATHHAMVVRGLWQAGGRVNFRLSRVYGPVCALAYVATLGFGALAYPSYRYYVRGLYLNRYDVWAARLFEVKEDLAFLGVLAALGVWFLGKSLGPKSERLHLVIYALLVWLVPAIVWFSTVSGLLISMVRSV